MKFLEADHRHERSLRHLVNSMPMPGPVRIAFSREPDFFDALSVEGNPAQAIAFMEEDAVVGMGVRTIKKLYIHGTETQFGYLSNLRIKEEYRNGMALARGYRFIKQLHKDGQVSGYLTAIVDDNANARRYLESGRAGLPDYIDLGRLFTYAVNIRRGRTRKRENSTIKVMSGRDVPLEDIITFMNENGPHKQFYPVLSESDFGTRQLRGFEPGDFYVAINGSRIVGVSGVWDHRNFKQHTVHGYGPLLTRCRPILNVAMHGMGFNPLPPPGQSLNAFYVAFTSVLDNDPALFSELLEAIYNDQKSGDYHFFLVGLHENDRLRQSLKGFFCVPYISRLFAVCWEDGRQFCNELKGDRILHVEIATM